MERVAHSSSAHYILTISCLIQTNKGFNLQYKAGEARCRRLEQFEQMICCVCFSIGEGAKRGSGKVGEGCSRIRYMSGEDVGGLMTKCQYAKSQNTNRLETLGERWEGSTDDVGCKAILEIWGSKGSRKEEVQHTGGKGEKGKGKN